jgi:Bacterial PH domain/Short C-terminal domain
MPGPGAGTWEDGSVSRYADTLLADGERVVLRVRQHWLAPLETGRMAWAMFVAALVLIGLDAQLQSGVPRNIFGALGLVLLVVSLLWLAQVYIAWYNEDYLITNRRALKVEGILRKRAADSSLEKINDAVLDQPLLGRMLGYGDLDILTASEDAIDHYHMLAKPTLFKRTMLDQKHRLEMEAFQIPAPPLRSAPPGPFAPAVATTSVSAEGVASDAPPASAAPTSAGPVTAPVPAAPVSVAPTASGNPTGEPGAPGPSAMSADEITRALGDLADLRDRGAISPDEYEAKKRELLGRL